MWGSRTTHITLPDGERKAMTTPREAAFSVDDLRGKQMIPGRGAWTWAHLWMSADELVLHADYDWDRDVGYATSTAPMSSSASPATPSTPRTGSPRAPPGADAPPRSTTASNTPWPTG